MNININKIKCIVFNVDFFIFISCKVTLGVLKGFVLMYYQYLLLLNKKVAYLTWTTSCGTFLIQEKHCHRNVPEFSIFL